MTRWLRGEALVASAAPILGRDRNAGPTARTGSLLAQLDERSGRMRSAKLVNTLSELLQFHRSGRCWDATAEDVACLFRRLVAGSAGRECLHLVAGDPAPPVLGPDWRVVDLLEHDCGDERLLQLDDAKVDMVFCTGLERVQEPERLVAELRRVLKQHGQVWIEVPFNAPYRPDHERNLPDYWRISPEGLRLLMRGFDEIFCSGCQTGGMLQTTSFFYGIKAAEYVWREAPTVKASKRTTLNRVMRGSGA